MKVRLDLTRKKLALLNASNAVLKDHDGYYASADVNCRIRAKVNDKFFSIASIGEIETVFSENVAREC